MEKKPRKKRRLTQDEVLKAIQLNVALAAAPDTMEVDSNTLCVFYGGSRPINLATLYRGIKSGRFAPPRRPGKFLLGDARKFKDRLNGLAVAAE